MATIPSVSDADLPASAQTMLTTVTLTESDIPGAILTESMDRHTMPELRWWLLCRGIKAPTSWKKNRLLSKYSMLRYTAAKHYIIFSAYFIISEGFKMLKRTNFQLWM